MTRVCAIAPQMELELEAYESVGLAVQAYELPEIDRKSIGNRTKIDPKRSLAASGLSGTIRERFRTSPRGTESASRPPLRALGTARKRLGVALGPPRNCLGSVGGSSKAVLRRLWDVRSGFEGDLGGASFDEAYRTPTSIVFRRSWTLADLDFAAQAQCFVMFRTFSLTHAKSVQVARPTSLEGGFIGRLRRFYRIYRSV